MKKQKRSGSFTHFPPLVPVAAVPKQPVEDAALFQGSEVIDVLCNNGDVAGLAMTRPLAAVLVVRQCAEQRVVLVGGEVVPGRLRGGVRPHSPS